MKIVFVGGGTGGHFYPLTAVAEEVEKYAVENQLIKPKMYYFGPNKYDEKVLYDAGLVFVRSFAGKIRRTKNIQSYILNFFSFIPICIGIIQSLVSLFIIYPDVVFSKGGYTSVPVVFAARILRIPIIIHESDASFGKANAWAKKFAKYIAISYPEVEKELTEEEKKKTALIGVPVRKDIKYNPIENAHDIFKMDKNIPIVIVLGGSSGAQFINQNIIDALPQLLKKYQIIHIAGKANYDTLKKETTSFLRGMKGSERYLLLNYLDPYNLRALYSVASVAISRAGSGTIFELADWGIPSLIIPIKEEVSHDQKKNAYAYARSGAAMVIEEQNLTPGILINRIDVLLNDKEVREERIKNAKEFSTPDAAKKIADVLVNILKSHEI